MNSQDEILDPDPAGKAGVLLLSGFLGAGKTTLLRRILSWQTDLSGTVVLVNEFGDVGIDGTLLETAGSGVVELTSGCICCTLSADLKQSLHDIRHRFQPKRIFIESTGVADPTAIIDALADGDLAGRMSLEKVVTVLDAEYWEAREHFGALFYRQLESAHLILLNKIDVIDPAMIPRFLEEIHALLPGCRVVPTLRCAIDPETLWMPCDPTKASLKPIQFFRESPRDPNAPGNGQPVSPPLQFETFSFEDHRVMEKSAFKVFLESLPWEIFRVKGPVRFSDGTSLLNFVGGKGEWSDWDGEAVTRLAFIGWNADGEAIKTRLTRCIASD